MKNNKPLKIYLSGPYSSKSKKKRLVNRFKIHRADISSFRIQKKFGAVISLFHVFSYLTKNSTIRKTFSNASFQLEKGGLFIFDLWYAPAVFSLKPQNKIKEIENEDLKVYRITEPKILSKMNIVEVNFKLIIINKKTKESTFVEESHNMRYFTLPEIEFLADQSSFEVLKVEEFITGNEPSESTWGVCFILRKK